MHTLCSQQLSGYDGMRAVMALLHAAANLKHTCPTEDECVLLLRAIVASVHDKLQAGDLLLLQAAVDEVFPVVRCWYHGVWRWS